MLRTHQTHITSSRRLLSVQVPYGASEDVGKFEGRVLWGLQGEKEAFYIEGLLRSLRLSFHMADLHKEP